MSNTRDKLRSLFLAMLMVFSVFAGTVAISGTAAGNIAGGSLSVAGNTQVGQPITADINSIDSGETVTIENRVNGNVVNTVEVTDGGSNDLDGSENGAIKAELVGGKTKAGISSGNSDIIATGEDGNQLSDTYTTDEYNVTVTEEVIHGSTTTIEGTIFSYPGQPAQVTLDYSLQFDGDLDDTSDKSFPLTGDESDLQVLADSDTSNGQFVVRKTFNNVDTDGGYGKDYPDDSGSFEDNEPGYVVYVSDDDTGLNDYDDDGDGEANDFENDGFDVVDTRLDVTATAELNAGSGDPVYDRSSDITGDIANESGQVPGETVQFEDPGGTTQKTTTAQNDGTFAFTAVTNDAGEWTVGTNAGGFVNYVPISVDTQEANLTLATRGTAQVDFQNDYIVELEDYQGTPIETNRKNDLSNNNDLTGTVNISGPFRDGSGSGTAPNSVNGDIETIDKDGSDGVFDFIEVSTNASSGVQAQFTAEPTDTDQVARLADADGNSADGVEIENDAADTPDTPDYAGTDSVQIGAAEPINIVNLDVEDGQDGRFSPSPSTATASSIFNNPPSEIEPLPLARNTGERVVNGFRLGDDQNRLFSEFTEYRVSFTLVDQNSDPIEPTGTSTTLDRIYFQGAGVNATFRDGGTGIVDVDGDETNLISFTNVGGTNGQYTAVIRPTRVDEPGETFDITVEADDSGVANVSTGGQNQPSSIETSGLYVPRFQIDNGSTNGFVTVDEVAGNQTIDVSAQVKNPETDPNVVNNGRVNVSQLQNDDPNTPSSTANVQLGSIDARTSSIGNGSYGFSNIDVGPRGIETGSDGIGDDVAQLVFSAYQYEDANGNQALNRDEVNNATVETLDIATNNNIQVEYLNATIADGAEKYAGQNASGTFTVTQGVEYEDITLELVRDDGTPVNLTDGLVGQEAALDDLETTNSPDTGEPIVHISGPTAGVHQVEFDEDESAPGAGVYQIDDIEDTADVSSSNSGLDLTDGDESDTFVFDNLNRDDGTLFQFVAQTPDLTNATASDEGLFVADTAQIETEIVGAAGDAVPNSVDDGDNANANGNVIDELQNDQSDWTSDFNTNVSNITRPTADVDRVYRVNATVTDALGTPLNDSNFNDIRVDFEGSEDPTPPGNAIGDNAKFEMVNGPGVGVNFDDGILQLGDTFSDGAPSNSNNDEALVNNENGTFQFDIEVESAGNDGIYTPVFEVEAQATASASPTGKSDATYSPTIQNPVVNVLDRSGSELPTADSSGNDILAQDVENRLRIEAFPADEDGFTLPDGLAFGFTDPKAENTAGGTTTLSQEVVTENFSEGQTVFIRVTPTGTGTGVVSLTDQVDGTGVQVRDLNGDRVVFDVLSSNLQVDISLSSASVNAGQSFTTTLTQQSTGDRLPQNTRVSLVSPDGNEVASNLTDANGQVTITVPVGASASGTYTVETRPAGFEPNSAQLNVNQPLDRDVTIQNVNLDPSTVQNGTTNDHTLTFDAEQISDDGNTDTFTVTIPSAATLDSANDLSVTDEDGNAVSLSGGPSVSGNTITFDVAPDSSEAVRNLTVEANVTVTVPTVPQTTSADIAIDVTDSRNGQDSASATLTIENASAGDGLDRFDTNGQAGIQRGEVVDAIVAFNSDNNIGGQPVERGDVVDLIVEFNT